MKKLVRCFSVGALLVMSSLPSFAVSPVVTPVTPTKPVNRAVNIDIGSIGGALDAAALRAIRQVVGYGIASGAVDSFTVYSPKAGAVPIEGGLSACAGAGFGANNAKFNAFIQDLKAIKAKVGTIYTAVPAISCGVESPALVACTMDVKSCPDGSYVGRTAPSCAFAPCPDPIKK